MRILTKLAGDFADSSSTFADYANSGTSKFSQQATGLHVTSCGCLACTGQASQLPDNAPPVVDSENFTLPDSADGYIRALFGNSNTWTGTYGQAATVEYAFNKTFSWHPLSPAVNLSDASIATAREALALWSSYANITFVEVAANNAELGFMDYDLAAGVGGVCYRYGNSTTIVQSVVSVDTAVTDFSMGSWGRVTHIHEIGHALGLKHPGNYNASGGGTGGPYLTDFSLTDSRDFSIMSYYAGTYANNWNHPTTAMLYDIAAIQYLYGANTSYNSGNTTYNIGGSANAWTLWDGGGTDTLNTTSYTSGGVTLDLREGASHVNTVGANYFWVAFNANIENATTGSGADRVTGNSSSNVITTNGGADTLIGGTGTDTLIGGAGNDIYVGVTGDGADVIQDSDGTGQLRINGITVTGTATNNQITLSGTTFTFTSTNGDLIVRISGNSSDSWTIDDYTSGNLGIFATTNLSLTGTTGNETLSGGEGDDTISALAGNDRLIAGSGADSLSGGDGNDSLYGQAGSDTLLGGNGADLLHGGDGDDAIYIDTSDLQAAIDGGNGSDTIYGSGGVNFNMQLSRVEFFYGDASSGNDTVTANGSSTAVYISGLAGNDSLNGGSGADTILGGSGNDSLNGGSENDSLEGGAGIDRLFGGDGNDTLVVDSDDLLSQMDGGNGTDTVYVSGATGISWNLFLSRTEIFYGSDGGNDTVVATGVAGTGVTIDGRGGNDNIIGSAQGDLIYGGEGNDSINGREGNDTIYGGAGSDFISGGSGNDEIYMDSGDTLSNLNGGAGTDTLIITHTANLVINAYILDFEIIRGSDGGNDHMIAGGATGVTFEGRGGNDTMVGGTGADVFVFDRGDGSDYIVMNDTNDKINIDTYVSADLTITAIGGQFYTVSFNAQGGAQSGDLLTVKNTGGTLDISDFVFI